MRVITLDETTRMNLLADLLKRDPNHYDVYTKRVTSIVEDVKEKKDEALFAYTEQFDGVILTKENIRVSEEEIQEALKSVDQNLLEIMKRSMENIRTYHEKQKRNSWFESKPDGSILGQKSLLWKAWAFMFRGERHPILPLF